MEIEETEKRQDHQMFYWLIVAIGVVIILWSGLTYFFVSELGTDAGVLGDSFGAVNALFSSLAFAFLIYTAMMQRKELSLQRKELEATREELRLTREAHEKHVHLFQEDSRARYRPIFSSGGFKLLNKDRFIARITVKNNPCLLIRVDVFDTDFANVENIIMDGGYVGVGETIEIEAESTLGRYDPDRQYIVVVFFDLQSNVYEQVLLRDGTLLKADKVPGYVNPSRYGEILAK